MDELTAAFEEQYLRQALKKAGGVVGRCAEISGLSRSLVRLAALQDRQVAVQGMMAGCGKRSLEETGFSGREKTATACKILLAGRAALGMMCQSGKSEVGIDWFVKERLASGYGFPSFSAIFRWA